jgi:hypothetical protein
MQILHYNPQHVSSDITLFVVRIPSVVALTRSCKSVQIPIQGLHHLTLRWPGDKDDLVKAVSLSPSCSQRYNLKTPTL